MLLLKKNTYVGLLVAVLAYTAFINQAMADLTISEPIAATDPLVVDAVTAITDSPDLLELRQQVRIDRMISQTDIKYDNPIGTQLPMQAIMIPLMQAAIMTPMMESLSDLTNADGLAYVLAPTFEGETAVPLVPPEAIAAAAAE